MSALVVAGVAAGTVVAVATLAVATLKFDFSRTLTPAEADAAVKKDAIQTSLIFGGIIAIGALLNAKTPHTDIGKGLMLGAGGLLAVGLYDYATTPLPSQRPNQGGLPISL